MKRFREAHLLAILVTNLVFVDNVVILAQSLKVLVIAFKRPHKEVKLLEFQVP